DDAPAAHRRPRAPADGVAARPRPESRRARRGRGRSLSPATWHVLPVRSAAQLAQGGGQHRAAVARGEDDPRGADLGGRAHAARPSRAGAARRTSSRATSSEWRGIEEGALATRMEKVNAGLFLLVGTLIFIGTIALIAGFELRRSGTIYRIKISKSVGNLRE